MELRNAPGITSCVTHQKMREVAPEFTADDFDGLGGRSLPDVDEVAQREAPGEGGLVDRGWSEALPG